MVNVCQTCGDQGFVEALVYCDSCKIAALHRYCLNITPVPLEEYITWFCEDCDGSDNGSDCKEVDLPVEHPGHTNVDEPVKVSSSPTKETRKEFQKQEISDIGKPQELTGLVRDGASVLEMSETKKKKKKKKKKSSNHTPSVVAMEASCSPTKETRKECESRKISDCEKPLEEFTGNVLETKKKSNHTLPVQDLRLTGATNVEPARQRLSSSLTKETRKELERREISDRVSISETCNSDRDSCTSKKRKFCSSKPDEEPITCKPTTPEPNMAQRLEGLDGEESNNWAHVQDKALPIIKPIWSGSISIKEGSICSIDGLVAHLSSLACRRVHDTACSLRRQLSAEVFPRLKIWPKSFLNNGGPKDESIALYFFPSNDSNEKVFDSLLDEMKKNDFGMRCVLDNADLLLFTSYRLPMHSWRFRSKEYLWGVFRAKR